MNHIKLFEDFNKINEENSKNDPLPELRLKNKLGIILLGQAGAGKSYFAEKFIIPRNSNIKTFSTDDISLTMSKDPNIYYKGSSDLNLKRLKLYMKSGKSFIYDTTGTQEQNIKDIYNTSKEFGYTTIFIHIVAPLETSIKQSKMRLRHVPEDYIKLSYERQFHNISKYSEDLNPDGYYIVQNKDGKYKFSKYESGKIQKKKSSRYKY